MIKNLHYYFCSEMSDKELEMLTTCYLKTVLQQEKITLKEHFVNDIVAFMLNCHYQVGFVFV